MLGSRKGTRWLVVKTQLTTLFIRQKEQSGIQVGLLVASYNENTYIRCGRLEFTQLERTETNLTHFK